jgi:hypothetical protein
MNNDVYWVGQNGNIYLKTTGGVRDMGKLLPTGRLLDNGVSGAQQGSFAAGGGRIEDPALANAPQSTAPAGGGGGGAARPVLNQAGINLTQGTIDQIPGLLEQALAAERQKYGNTRAQFDQEESAGQARYKEGDIQTQQNYDANMMAAIRSGVKGLGGIMGLLRGTGAEGQGRDAVGSTVSTDIREGADTFKENQTALKDTLGSLLSGLKMKRQQNEDTLVNNERATRRGFDTQLQDLFKTMAGFYGEVGDQGNVNSWMNRAGSLTPQIAQNSTSQVSKYDTTPVAVKAPELAAFADPTQQQVAVNQEGQVGTGIFSMTDPRRRKDQTAPVGV